MMKFRGKHRKLCSVAGPLSCAVFLLFLWAPLSFAVKNTDEAFGVWNTYDIEKKMNDKIKMKVGEELRFKEGWGINYMETHLGLDYLHHKYLAVGADYQEIRSSRKVGKKAIWSWDNVPRIYAAPQAKIYGFDLSDRNMLEFHFKEDQENTVRYRNLVTLVAPYRWTRFKFQPYSANEIFVESNRNGFVEDRFFNGFKFHLWDHLYGSIYYLRRFEKNSIGKWTDTNIFGTNIKYSF